MPVRVKKALALLLLLLLAVQGTELFLRQRQAVRLPVLMYHHFDQNAGQDTVVTGARFREQMTALKAAGYHAITLDQMLDYVDRGTPLPDNPVLITMDDGYSSNLTVAAPVLEELGMCATVFVIGVYEGEALEPHSGSRLYLPRFSYEEAAPWVEKGVLDLQSHSFDCHQLAADGRSGRDGMLPLVGESEAEYHAALETDMEAYRQRRAGRTTTDLKALAYPYGYYTWDTDQFLAAQGIRCTFTTQQWCNWLRPGQPDCLRLMSRYNVTEKWTGDMLVRWLKQ